MKRIPTFCSFLMHRLFAWGMPLLALLLVSCTTTGAATKPFPVAVDPACTLYVPIYVSKDDVLSDQTAREILGNNDAWALRCSKDGPPPGWHDAQPAVHPAY